MWGVSSLGHAAQLRRAKYRPLMVKVTPPACYGEVVLASVITSGGLIAASRPGSKDLIVWQPFQRMGVFRVIVHSHWRSQWHPQKSANRQCHPAVECHPAAAVVDQAVNLLLAPDSSST